MNVPLCRLLGTKAILRSQLRTSAAFVSRSNLEARCSWLAKPTYCGGPNTDRYRCLEWTVL